MAGKSQLFESLSTYPNLDYFVGEGPDELKGQLDQITLPCKIVSIYAIGARHIAWVSLTKPINKVKKTKGSNRSASKPADTVE